MARVKRAVHSRKKRREILESAKGYRGSRRTRLRVAKEQVMHSGAYAYRDRRDRKGQFRRLWITRIGAATRADGLQGAGRGGESCGQVATQREAPNRISATSHTGRYPMAV